MNKIHAEDIVAQIRRIADLIACQEQEIKHQIQENDRLKQQLAAANAEIASMRGSETYGCHCDLEPGQKPDGCVIDKGRPSDCGHAIKILKEGKTKLDCRYWQIIQTDKL